jgi:hypothetical protein
MVHIPEVKRLSRCPSPDVQEIRIAYTDWLYGPTCGSPATKTSSNPASISVGLRT